MTTFHLRLAGLATATLLLAGCASDADVAGPSEVDQEPPVSTEGNAPEDDEPVESRGAVRVNEATTYSITELRRCEPLDDEMIERELELQGFGEHDGERVQIDVYLQTLAGAPQNHVSWAGPEGVFGSDPLDGGRGDARVTWGPDDASVLGSATMFDALAGEERIMLDFDLEVPADTVACR
ncbi:hypothetical protein ACFQZV_13120 [Microbacterium koreense]|uniref:Lipoprotein n=1 Tax=Microbacterium koreense TaxID=323761 RepID=A0ABW2ZUA7_9MICO